MSPRSGLSRHGPNKILVPGHPTGRSHNHEAIPEQHKSGQNQHRLERKWNEAKFTYKRGSGQTRPNRNRRPASSRLDARALNRVYSDGDMDMLAVPPSPPSSDQLSQQSLPDARPRRGHEQRQERRCGREGNHSRGSHPRETRPKRSPPDLNAHAHAKFDGERARVHRRNLQLKHDLNRLVQQARWTIDDWAEDVDAHEGQPEPMDWQPEPLILVRICEGLGLGLELGTGSWERCEWQQNPADSCPRRSMSWGSAVELQDDIS